MLALHQQDSALYNLKMVIWMSHDTIRKSVELDVHYGRLGT